jgi:hypothetical protein
MEINSNKPEAGKMTSTRKVTGTKVFQTETYWLVEIWENGSTDPTRIVITYKASGKTEFISLV